MKTAELAYGVKQLLATNINTELSCTMCTPHSDVVRINYPHHKSGTEFFYSNLR